MNYIVTNNRSFFEKIGNYNYCSLDEMDLPQLIAVDSETTTLNPRQGYMFSVQIGTGKDNYLIDMQQLGGEITFDQVIPYLKGKTMVFHNAAFDLGWFYRWDFFPEKVYDTLLASQILYNGWKSYRHGFAYCMERELGLNYDKTEQKNIHKTQLSNHKTIQYAFDDVDKLLDLMKTLANKLRDWGAVPAFKLHCRYIRALAYMEQCGLPINTEMWQNKMQEDERILEQERIYVTEYIWDNLPEFRDTQLDMFSTDKKIKVELTSSLQMQKVFEAFGVDITSDDDHTKKSIDKKVIEKSDHEFVGIWLKYKQAEHDVTTYGANVLEKVSEDGRIYTTFKPILDTARISTRKGGVNILNLPANDRTRYCFEAKCGYSMVVADYEGQENSVGADLHRDPVMVASINEGKDLHCAFARMIYPEISELSDEEIIKNHKSKRTSAKSPRFLFSYGGGAFTLSVNANIPLEEAQKLEKLYNELHPEIKVWGEANLEAAIEKGYIESADGFKLRLPYFEDFQKRHKWVENKDSRYWKKYRVGKEQYKKLKKADEEEDFEFELYDEPSYNLYMEDRAKIGKYFSDRGKYYRLCLNNPVQARSAFQTKRAACMLFEEIIRNGHQWLVRISNIPHDEFVLEVVDRLAEQYKPILEKCMVEGGDYYLSSGLISMKAEANLGKSWGEAK